MLTGGGDTRQLKYLDDCTVFFDHSGDLFKFGLYDYSYMFTREVVTLFTKVFIINFGLRCTNSGILNTTKLPILHLN